MVCFLKYKNTSFLTKKIKALELLRNVKVQGLFIYKLGFVPASFLLAVNLYYC